MKHVTGLLGQIWYMRQFESVIVYGKGATFDPEAHKRLKNPCIIAINDAVNKLTHCDIIIMNDLNVINNLTFKGIQCTKQFFIPSSIPRRDRHNSEILSYQATEFWIRNAEKLAMIGRKAYYFDANFLEFDFFPDQPIYTAFHSTYETLLHILGSNGIKKIYTSGIDYNSNYHDDFKKEFHNDFSAMRPHVEEIKRVHGILEIKA